MLPTTTTRRSNFPTRPQKAITTNYIPEDVISSGRNLYTQIEFVAYSFGYQTFGTGLSGFLSNIGVFGGRGGVARPNGGMVLPIPKKINESQTLTWEQDSATRIAASVGSLFAGPASSAAAASAFGGAGNFISALSGLQINPYLFMYFKSPNYKEFSFSWTFAPNNQRESQALANIINQFKANSLPTFGFAFMGYPNIALIRLMPSDLLGNLKFKPCAITSVLVDYTGAGPSFFKSSPGNSSSSGAPTVVNLTVNFKEIQLWDRNEITNLQTNVSFPAFDPATGVQVPEGTPNSSSLPPMA